MPARATTHPPLFAFDPPPAGAPTVRARRLTREDLTRYVAPHGHRFLELRYFAEPAGGHRRGDDAWDTQAGDLLLIPAGMVHAWAPATPGEAAADRAEALALAEVWIVEFTPSAVDPGRADAGSLGHLVASPLLFPFLNTSSTDAGRYTVPPDDRPAWRNRLRALASELAREPGEPALVAANAEAHAHLVLLVVEAARLAASSAAAR